MKFSIRLFFSVAFSLFAFSVMAQEYGMASYYDDQYHGKKTASGELYDKEKMTCAHKSLLFGSIVRVTRLDNDKSIEVRVNDRGPYIKGRIVDLSGEAAERLGIVSIGETKVKVDILKKKSISDPKPTPAPPVATAKKPVPKTEVVLTEKGKGKDEFNIEKGTPTVKEETPIVKKETPSIVKTEAATTSAPVPYEAVADRVTRKIYSDYDLYSIKVDRPRKAGFGVQVSALLDYKNVMRLVAQLQESNYDDVMISVEQNKSGKTRYKVIVGPYPDRSSAKASLKELKKKKHEGFVVPLANLVH